MAVFRVEKTRDYTIMANYHLKDRNLSLKSKGLLSIMLSLPESWDYTLSGLSRLARDGKDAVRQTIHELEDAGYIVRSRTRNAKGQLKGAEYIIYEKPQPRADESTEPIEEESSAKNPPASDALASEPPAPDAPAQESPALEQPVLENPTQGLPTLDFPTQLKTQESITYPFKKNPFTPPSSVTNPSYPSIYPYADADQWRAHIRAQVEYDSIVTSTNQAQLDELIEVIVETLCADTPCIRISGVNYHAAYVKQRLLLHNQHSMEYAMDALSRTTRTIHNIKNYLLTALFNASATVTSYYEAEARHDLAAAVCGEQGMDGGT